MSIIPGIENTRAGAHRDQQRIVAVAQPLAGALLEPAEVLGDLAVKAVGTPAAVSR